MEKKEGYKKTKIGWIPGDWDFVKIGSFTKPESKKNLKGEITRVVSVTKYDGIVDSLSYFNKQVYSKDITSYKIICRGHFAYATIHLDEGSIGCLDIYEKAVLSPMYTVFSIDSTIVNRIYLFSLLKSNRLMNIYNHIGAGSINRRKSISYTTFSKIDIPLPPLPEQKKIAAILSTVDKKIESIEEQIKQTELLKKGLMNKLLTEGIGHTEFKDTEVGRIPRGWDVVKLGDISEFINGRGFKPHEWANEGLPIIRIQNLNGGKEFNYYTGKYASKILIKKGDLLFAWSGSRGTSFGPHIWNGTNGLLNYHTWKVGYSSTYIKRDYLYCSLKRITTKIENDAHGAAALVHIQKRFIVDYLIPLPHKTEQEGIASILSKVDEKIEILQSKKSKHETLKKGLMQQLLTGKIRVKT
ncbi:restriction endonuclease subunit S [Desulfobacterales bacterium HSG16]|nr:restriction endonuclease subunit S [Desulfobacterales bacterium HSG16]